MTPRFAMMCKFIHSSVAINTPPLCEPLRYVARWRSRDGKGSGGSRSSLRRRKEMPWYATGLQLTLEQLYTVPQARITSAL